MQPVYYTQSSQMATDLMTGRIDFQMPTTGAHIGNVTSGAVRALAVSGHARAKLLPDVPTLIEQRHQVRGRGELVRAVRAQGHAEGRSSPRSTATWQRILAMPDIKEREAALGFRFIGGPPEKLAAFLQERDREMGRGQQDVRRSPGS